MFAPVLPGYANHAILGTHLLSTISFLIYVAVLWLPLNIYSLEQELYLPCIFCPTGSLVWVFSKSYLKILVFRSS